MAKLFGTDGIRGTVDVDMTLDLARKVGEAAAINLRKSKNKATKIVIARDTRLSGDRLYGAIAAGIMSRGGEVIDIGVLPTPATAYFIKELNCDVGIVISASHNPYTDNGIKIFDSKGYKINSDIETQIEEFISRDCATKLDIINEETGTASKLASASEIFVERYLNLANCDLRGLKIVLDCANGAASHIAPEIFEKLGAEVIAVHCEPNGTNINFECGSTDTRSLSKTVLENSADIGVAFDGDADRLICVDEFGEIINGDRLLAAIALDMKSQNKLNKNTIVCTSMSNLGMRNYLINNKINIITSDVGDSYVAQMMRDNDLNLGGEQSGHVILSDYCTTGDGILASIILSRILKNAKIQASDLNNAYADYPQVMINVIVPQNAKTVWESDEIISLRIAQSSDKLGDKGRVLVRSSGTENLIRVMLEGENLDFIQSEAEDIAQIIRTAFPIGSVK